MVAPTRLARDTVAIRTVTTMDTVVPTLMVATMGARPTAMPTGHTRMAAMDTVATPMDMEPTVALTAMAAMCIATLTATVRMTATMAMVVLQTAMEDMAQSRSVMMTATRTVEPITTMGTVRIPTAATPAALRPLWVHRVTPPRRV